MNNEELRRIRDQEREKDSLQHLPPDFYSEVGAYLEELRVERDRAAASTDDPFSDPDVRRLNERLERAERIVEALYERRVGKIVRLASFEAADMTTEEEGLTDEEGELCEAIVARIRTNRERILETIAGEHRADETDEDAYARGRTDEAEGAPQDQPSSSEGEEHTDPSEERTTVRITRDLGEIVGTDDRTYELAADDIVSLPKKNAEPLLSRGAAELVD